MTFKLITTNETLMTKARSGMSEIERRITHPVAIIIMALDESGAYKIRSYSDTSKIKDFDMYARAEAALARQKNSFLGE